MRMSWLARAVNRCTSFWHSGRVSSSRKSCAQAQPVRVPAEHRLSTFLHSSLWVSQLLLLNGHGHAQAATTGALLPESAAATALHCLLACEAVKIETKHWCLASRAQRPQHYTAFLHVRQWKLKPITGPLLPESAAATALPCVFACEAVVIEHLLLHESLVLKLPYPRCTEGAG